MIFDHPVRDSAVIPRVKLSSNSGGVSQCKTLHRRKQSSCFGAINEGAKEENPNLVQMVVGSA